MTLSSGYCFSQEWPVRETRRRDSWSMKQMARTPSYLTSKSHSSPRGGVVASAAFMGVMAVGMAAFTAPFSDAGLATVLCGAGGADLAATAAGRLAGRLFHSRWGSPAVSCLVLRAGK